MTLACWNSRVLYEQLELVVCARLLGHSLRGKISVHSEARQMTTLFCRSRVQVKITVQEPVQTKAVSTINHTEMV